MKKNITINLFMLVACFIACSTKRDMTSNPNNMIPKLSGNLVKYSYSESYKTLGHNSEPWETTDYSGIGDFWLNSTTFLRNDTLTNSRGRKYASRTDFANDTLLYIDYGDEGLMQLSEEMYYEKIINTARYTPFVLLHYFNESEDVIKRIDDAGYVYKLDIGPYEVQLLINHLANQIDRISYLSYDELYGDVTTTYIYTDYESKLGNTYPTTIKIHKVNGKVIEQVDILAVEETKEGFERIKQPSNHTILPAITDETIDIKVTHYNDYIHFIDLQHTDDRVVVVELDDYMVVAEAPINSHNGELIIAEARKIAPNKAIKYFIFGHHHPHYLGGLRAFVHKEATILCTTISEQYVRYIAEAPHTLQPDSLELEPKELKTQTIQDSFTLGIENQMKIYFMGERSAHTKDFLFYYFPQEKLLFQDDLCWIPKEGPIRKAGARQVGLYNMIKDLGLTVDTIIQSWPVSNHKVKTIIPFEDLEASMTVE